MAEFSINEKEKIIKIRLKDWDIALEDSIENKEKDFYEKLRCIWKLNLPKDIKTKICEEYGKLCGQAILYENEIDYALENMMDDILMDEYIVSTYYEGNPIDFVLLENNEIWDYLDDD